MFNPHTKYEDYLAHMRIIYFAQYKCAHYCCYYYEVSTITCNEDVKGNAIEMRA